MKFYATITNRKGKEVKIGDNEGLEIVIKGGNRTLGILNVEMWGLDTDEPFRAMMWYPSGDRSRGDALEFDTKGETIKGTYVKRTCREYDCENGAVEGENYCPIH